MYVKGESRRSAKPPGNWHPGQNITAHHSKMTSHPSRMGSGHNTKKNAGCGSGRWWWGHALKYGCCAPAVQQHRRRFNSYGVLRRIKSQSRRAMQLGDGSPTVRMWCSPATIPSNHQATLMGAAIQLLEPPIYSDSAVKTLGWFLCKVKNSSCCM